jgi:hypothetical protein
MDPTKKEERREGMSRRERTEEVGCTMHALNDEEIMEKREPGRFK